MSFLVEHVLMAPEGARLILAYSLLRLMLDERDPQNGCTPNEHYNRLACATCLLLAEFAAQFPTEAAELEIFERQDQSGLHSAACQIAMHSPRTRRASPGAASLGRNASVPMRSRTSKAKQAPRYRKPLAMSQG